ncbi:hypothetical protein D8674_014995 [Pyrus ussuriensis x Pyrus communis]|uniref:Uncharacterized protein n=1 Tax=Pyrus ussuriensis x Pyrus communis TaxID=2448454 RepID=A0A5N5GU27_9ROSA|nr:hypothetical protein D8674_014995 [Pyrus ussuriensis x Pyrus communis]
MKLVTVCVGFDKKKGGLEEGEAGGGFWGRWVGALEMEKQYRVVIAGVVGEVGVGWDGVAFWMGGKVKRVDERARPRRRVGEDRVRCGGEGGEKEVGVIDWELFGIGSRFFRF